ncbi:unnamed protein product [Phytophthora lilii]|uniref:Unnamed protein product n=1 Tax=Phytophthora lilii TaxID=2077276 RepID=A0A9W6TMN9_9STRA|nr:unnamed protein product [Phytophthora lilii]
MRRKQKPASAYQYYQKLAQDFDALEREMESHEEEQNDLEAKLKCVRAKIHTLKADDLQSRQMQWERERDRQLETFIQQRTAVDALRAQSEALEAHELRLQAEMEVLRERQQEISETEARRIRRLVHERTTLLDDELAKGKLDLDYIAQVVSTARRQELKQQNQRETHEQALSSVQNLVQDVHERRRREFEMAEENYQARMRSFQLEKDALAKKVKEAVTKQRALQILSQNQQLAIKGFFDTPSRSKQVYGASPPSPDFGEILQSLSQSGAQVEQIQTVDSKKNSGRLELLGALQEARATVQRGTQRIEAIQKGLQERKNEAHRLGIVVDVCGANSTKYDGAWGIESYSPRQYQIVYYMRALVFSWMDFAVAEVCAQPAKELLEFEVKRWKDTHLSVEQDLYRETTQRFAEQVLANLISETMVDIASDIQLEFECNAYRVRNAFTSAITDALFSKLNENLTSPQARKTATKTQTLAVATTPTLRSALFESSFNHLRTIRNRRSNSKSIAFLHQCTLAVTQRQPAPPIIPPQATNSPAKKKFGLLNSRKGPEAPPKKATSSQPQVADNVAPKAAQSETIPFASSNTLKTSPSPFNNAVSFWQGARLQLRTIVTPSSLGCPSCLHMSSAGDLLFCGTTEGDLVLWDLLPDQPTVLRTWSPAKSERSRITRVILSPDAQTAIAFFRRKTVSVFAINPSPVHGITVSQAKSKQALHSEDCFPSDPIKYKPRSLESLAQLSAADALAELSFSPDLRDRAFSAVAKDPATGWSAAEISSGSFFASPSLTGTTAQYTSILCGASTGDLLKLNLRPQRVNGEVEFYGIQAAFDAPGPEDKDYLKTKSIRREFFRGHERPVLFASCINRNRNRGERIATEIISVDQDGSVCVWEYSAALFSGLGWFEPSLKLRIELACSRSDLLAASSVTAPIPTAPTRVTSMLLSSPEVLKGEVLQVALTPNHARLVCMVFYADPTKKEVTGTLRFLQLLTDSMCLDRVEITTNFVGGSGAPRFSLTTNFIFLLSNNLVHVYGLSTGKKAREPISLSSPGQPQVVFNNIVCSTSSFQANTGSPTRMSTRTRRENATTITFVVSGDQHLRLLVHSFTASASQTLANNIKTKRER